MRFSQLTKYLFRSTAREISKSSGLRASPNGFDASGGDFMKPREIPKNWGTEDFYKWNSYQEVAYDRSGNGGTVRANLGNSGYVFGVKNQEVTGLGLFDGHITGHLDGDLHRHGYLTGHSTYHPKQNDKVYDGRPYSGTLGDVIKPKP